MGVSSSRRQTTKASEEQPLHSLWLLKGEGGEVAPQICSLCFTWASFTFSCSVEGGGCSRWQPIMS